MTMAVFTKDYGSETFRKFREVSAIDSSLMEFLHMVSVQQILFRYIFVSNVVFMALNSCKIIKSIERFRNFLNLS